MKLLSKSKYMSGLRCPKYLWQEIHASDRKTPQSPADTFRFQQGHEVGAMAREWRGDGTLIDFHPQRLDNAFEDRRKAIDSGAKRIYEMPFLHDTYLAIADIVEFLDDGCRLIEVKSTTKVKNEHIDDLAYQAWIMSHTGFLVSSVGVIHLNNKAVGPESKDILTYTDTTDAVLDRMKATWGRPPEIYSILTTQKEPETPISSHCKSPYPCPYKAHCWKDIGNDSVYRIPRIQADNISLFKEREWESMEDIKDLDMVSDNQRRWVLSAQTNKPIIDHDGIVGWISQLEYPVYSFDFETISYAIPRWDNTRPYQQIPFQFSTHLLNEQGEISHIGEYLHQSKSDPRPELIEKTISTLGDKGSIMVWHQSFEKSRINELMRDLPEYEDALNNILSRIVDLEDVFKHWYTDINFSGRTSIKAVGGIIVPGMGYEGMDISSGNDAAALWDLMTFNNDLGDDNIYEHLQEYCTRDTELPCLILEYLVNNS